MEFNRQKVKKEFSIAVDVKRLNSSKKNISSAFVSLELELKGELRERTKRKFKAIKFERLANESDKERTNLKLHAVQIMH